MNDLKKIYKDSKLVCQLIIISLLPLMFDYSVNTASVSFFIADFNLLSCEFDSFTFKLLYCVIFILIKIKPLYDIVFTKLLQFLVKIQKQFLLLLQE